MLKKFSMRGCNSAETPADMNVKLESFTEEEKVDSTLYRQIEGCLRFVCHTRHDISYSVGLVSRFMSDPRQTHLVAAKRILRYLKGTASFGVLFPCQEEKVGLQLVAYSDSDWCGDKVDRRSTMGYVLFLSGVPICWCSKKQAVIALSTCEA